jgi:NAD(P)-dependent dehydrogenase (short-subunit alcohol dehydrogenase family)/putative sterol carrier protein
VNAKTGESVIDNGIFEYGDIPADEIRFDGRVAVVTGAGGGLGRTYALELAKRGAKVVVNDYGGARDGAGDGSSSPADKVVAEIRGAGGEAVADYNTVATPEGGEGIVKTALSAFGRLDVLINNAGILRDKSIAKMEPEHWKAVIDVHLNGAYHVTRPAFAVMREQGYGRIVMTTSAAGLYGNFGQTNYSSAKLGLVGFMGALKLEGGKYNIKVNTVAPIAASRLTEDILPPDLLEKLKPEFVSPLVLYLGSDRCSVTGYIYNAGMGYYNRAAVMTGPGVVIGGGKAIPTVEDIASHWEDILNMKGAKEYEHLTVMVNDLMEAFQSGGTAEKVEMNRGGLTDVKAVFDRMAGAFNADAAAGVEAVFQYVIAGSGGGEWFAEVKGGKCAIEAGLHSNPICTLKMESADFLDLMNKKVTAMKAYTSGKLKIEGDLMKSQLIEKLFKF